MTHVQGHKVIYSNRAIILLWVV